MLLANQLDGKKCLKKELFESNSVYVQVLFLHMLLGREKKNGERNLISLRNKQMKKTVICELCHFAPRIAQSLSYSASFNLSHSQKARGDVMVGAGRWHGGGHGQ